MSIVGAAVVPNFDGHIQLLTEGPNGEHIHVYVIDGERNDEPPRELGTLPYVSSTAFVHRFMEPFDGPLAALRTVQGSKWCASRFRPLAERHARESLARNPVALALLPPPVAAYVAGTLELGALLASLPADVQRPFVERTLVPLWHESVIRQFSVAGEHGTLLHTRLERYFIGEHTLDDMAEFARTGAPDGSGGPAREYDHFIAFMREWFVPRGARFFRAELKIYDPRLRLCGATDLLLHDPDYANDGTHVILIDFKRVYGMTTAELATWGVRCKPPLSHLHECKFVGHALQQNMYRQVIEDNSRLIVTRIYLLVMHPENETYLLLEVPDMRAEIKAIFRVREAEVAAARAAADDALCAALCEAEAAHARSRVGS